VKASLRNVFLFVFVSFFIFCGSAAAQPDAGTLLQEQRQLVPSLPDRLPSEEKREIVQPPLTDTGVRVLIKAFRFTGRFEGMATEAELQELVKGSVGKELGFAELHQMAGHVTNYLREKKGFLLARAYLPKQDVTEGIIEIAVIAGRIDGKVRIDLKSPHRIRPSLLAGIADRAVPEDSPARMEKVERAVMLMNDLPGVNAQASFEPGGAPGTTRLVVNAAEGRLVQGVLSGDNYGDRYTGVFRGTGQIALQDPSGFGDHLSLAFTGAEHMLQGRAAYAIPLGATGLTGSLSYSYLSYELGEELAALKAKGRADTIGANLSYPLLRSRSASVWTGAGFEYVLLGDEANDVKTRDRKLSVGNVTLTGSFYDGFGGGGLTNTNIIIYGGNADLSGLETNKIADAAGPKTDGGFARGIYSLARLQRLTRLLALFGSVRGQLASGNLDSSQKFILGGPVGVRAYPVGEASGDDGHAGTVETRMDLPFMPTWAATQLVGFFDAGWVKLHRDLWTGAVTNATGRNDYALFGGGLGFNVGKPGLYSLRASYAHKVGLNEGRSATGKDGDNRSDDGRFWLQLLIWI
jgi:hemolysin activation/secretion protein